MQVPTADMVETAADNLEKLDQGHRDRQVKELCSGIGFAVASACHIGYPLTEDMKYGYLLGLQTARLVLQQDIELQMKGIDSTKLL